MLVFVFLLAYLLLPSPFAFVGSVCRVLFYSEELRLQSLPVASLCRAVHSGDLTGAAFVIPAVNT